MSRLDAFLWPKESGSRPKELGGGDADCQAAVSCRAGRAQRPLPLSVGGRDDRADELVGRFFTRGDSWVKTRTITAGVVGAGMILALASCTNPYDPGQRAIGGGLIGAGAGAAIGGAVGGGTGAAIGAATGGAVGAITGAATTPPPPGYYPPPPPPRY